MGTHYIGSKRETDALNAYIKLMRAGESITTRVHTLLPDDLTLSQFGVLETLLHRGPLCQGELAGKLLKSGGNLTLIVSNLEKAGLVTRERDAEDRRYITVSLTEKGRVLISELFPKIAARIADEFSALSTAEQFTLGWLCKKVGTRTGKSTAANPAVST
jgi:MarR family 2-MHQ and catechol resistance regulon transcriptional repressor